MILQRLVYTCLAIHVLLSLFPIQAAVQISEFMSANKTVLKDEDGDYPDWIEIYNPGPAKVDLRGSALTDDPGNLMKWKFPSYLMQTNEYLVIFASQKDRTNSASILHTNFKLSAKGGYLAFVDKSTNIVSEFENYPAQPDDISFGRDPLSPDFTSFQSKPTPGKINKVGGPQASPEVTFSEGGRNFLAPFSLMLRAALPDTVIRYTTNSSFPTTNSAVYTGPITVRTSMVVRARCFIPGLAPGPLHTEVFILMATNMLNFSSDLPILVIHTLGSSISSAMHRFSYMSLYEPRTGRSSITNRPTLKSITGLKTRGSSTGGLPKASWGFEFWDEYFDERDLSPLGMPADSDWVLYAANNFDPVLIHNPFIHTLTRGMGTYSSRTRFVEVFYGTGTTQIGTNNYYGLYVLEEKIKEGKERVDVVKIQNYDNQPPDVTGGYLFKIDRTGPGETGLAAGGNNIVMVGPDEATLKTPARTNQWNYLRDYFNAFGKALNGANWRDPVLGYAPYIDVDNWIDYHTIEVLSGNVDALVLSCYFYKQRNGKIMYGPHWDFDRALGSTDGRDANPKAWSTGPFFSSPWWARLLSDKDFWQKWVDRWQEIRTNAISNTSVNFLVDSLVNEVREAQPRDTAKWRNPLRKNYQNEVDLMKAWLSNRMDFIDKQLTPPPVLSSPGGRVDPGFTLSLAAATGSTIFYTLDGSDPRASQNDVSAKAIEYAGPITISANTRVMARARNLNQKQTGGPPTSTPWSALRAGVFVTAPSPLSISEIMYHPARTSAGKANDGDNFEFVEVRNNGFAPVSLLGVRFSGGIQFNFSTGLVANLGPGASVVVAKSVAAFTNRYGSINSLAGEYTGSLENKGETLTLLGPTGETVQQVTYDNKWYPITDGFGFSLVASSNILPASASTAKYWGPGTALHGTPGADEPVVPPIPAVVINEVLPHAGNLAAIELLNPGSTAADISGWFLSNDAATPRRYRIPSGTILGPGGFKSFSETNLISNGVAAFIPSPHGGKIYLFAANGSGLLLGYMHVFSYGPVTSSQAYARFLTATGVEVFRPAFSSTIDTHNAGPNPSPLAITEIMYHPQPFRTNLDAAIHEFVEIQNTTSQPLALAADPLLGGNWRLSGGVSFGFPTNLVLAPHQIALVVSFDPVLDPAERASFAQRFGVSSQTLLLGPYGGQLKNSEERLALEKPVAATDGSQTLDYLILDEVHYSRETPWPVSADGTGLSIQRIRTDGLGDDSFNWTSAVPSAGSLNASGDSDGDGLPDGWELAHQLDPFDPNGVNGPDGDPDADGIGNMREFVAGTDPRSAESYLRILDFTITGNPQITFYAIPNQNYTLVYSDDLKTGLWKALQTLAGPATAGEVTIEDKTPNRPDARFYKLLSP